MSKHTTGQVFVCGKPEVTFSRVYHTDDCSGCAKDKLRRDEELNSIDRTRRKIKAKKEQAE